MAYDANKDYTTAIKEAIASGASTETVNQLNAERNEKIAANQEKYGQYANDTKEMVSNYNSSKSSGNTSNKTTSTNTYSGAATKNITTYTDEQDSVKSQMDANSKKWWDVQAAYEAGTITDAERQAQQTQLHNANTQLQSQLGGSITYDSVTGQWSGSAEAPVVQQPQIQLQGYSYDSSGLTDTLKSWLAAAQKQSDTQINYATNQGILELQRAEEDAAAAYQTQRDQIAIDEAKALDNQALYAERRGDKGGIGQAQYNTIQNTAAINRLSVNSAQVKLSTDTARQIADLRAQGEFEKADAYLELTQQYLQQLISLEQWSAEFGLSVAQFNASLEQWQAEYDLKVADITGTYQGQQTLASKQLLAEAGLALAENGITPSSSQISAMKELYGYDSATVSSLVALANQKASKSSSSGSVTTSIANGASIVGLAVNYLGSNATKSDFTNWVKSNTELSTDSQISQAWKDYSGINWYAAAEKFWRDEIEKYAGTEAKVSAIEKCGLSNEAKTYLLAKLGVI